MMRLQEGAMDMQQLRTLLLAGLAATLGCAVFGDGAQESDDPPLLTEVRQLTFAGRRSGEGYFSADGRQLVFQSEREPGNPFFQIYAMDLERGASRRVSPGVGKTTCGWWHPSGQRVLFASTHLDPEAAAKQAAELELRASGGERRYAWDYDPHYDLFAADLASGALTRLSDAPGYDAEGSYSPDGRLVAFASNRHALAADATPEQRAQAERDPAGAMEIYVMAADGSDLRRLTTTRGYDGGPFFSPDGARIVWRRFSEDGSNAEIYTMRTDGGDVRQLTGLGALSWAPFYHPSGRYLIFATNLHGFENFELYLVDAEGRRPPLRVSVSEGFDSLPAFAPDGEQLAWTRRAPNGESQLFLARWQHAEALRRLGLEPEAPTPATTAAATPEPEPGPAKGAARVGAVRSHVEALASERMQGRLTGSEGESLATEYVARVFAEQDLEPAGDDGGWFQAFEFTAGVSLGGGNALRTLRGAEAQQHALDTDWRPLAFSRTGESAPAPIVFAGYGIVAPRNGEAPGYDAYDELDVSGRWVLLLRYAPQNVPPEQRQHWSRYASLRHKAMLARDRGALGVLIASGPRSAVREQLVPLRSDAAIGATSAFALSVTDALAASWLAASGSDLAEIQSQLDRGEAHPAFEIPELRLAAQVDLVQERRSGRNVLGRLRARRAAGAPPLLIGAHVDHLGHGVGGSSLAREDERGQIHPGADDNASGVAALIEIAWRLARENRRQPDAFARDVLFAAWSGEEIGLLGSAAFARALADPAAQAHGAPRPLAAALNLDMVGRLRDRLVLQGGGSSSVWPGLIERVNAAQGVPIALQEESYLPTDSTSFHLKGIPVLSAFTGVHPEYHTPRDTPDRLDYAGLARVADLVAGIAQALALQPELPDWLEPKQPESLAPRAGLRAYLGTIPSYGEVGGVGVPLAGVAAGGPAERAGLRGGDRIVQLGGHAVENIYDYTYALDALAIGEPVPIVVLRDGERVELTITPTSRD
jgi:Tol biopolymer transport system component